MPINYVNTDLDIESTEDLTELVDAFGDAVIVLHNRQENDGRFTASLEIAGPSQQPGVGMESKLVVRINDLFGGPDHASVSKPTNALLEPSPAMLVGVDIPGPGCWEVTGEFLGQTLTFVVETPLGASKGADAT